ncbi:MAG: PASTA domain-containing protein [Mediterranea sp.]|jgi:hypothetical protein|nr:PASTA domain-containing protein [Mediterranea sp.]
MNLKEFFSLKANKSLWLNLLAMVIVVVAILFATLKGLDVYTHHGDSVMVPDLKGMSVAQATQTLRNSKLQGIVVDSSYVKDQPAGIILELKPAVGEKVKEGRTIYLTINTLNIPLREVPDLADNSSLREAQAKVLAAGFRLDEVEYISGERDWVYGVKYQGRPLIAGDKAPQGAALTLMVGNGEADTLELDSLTDTDAEQAADSTGRVDDSWF